MIQISTAQRPRQQGLDLAASFDDGPATASIYDAEPSGSEGAWWEDAAPWSVQGAAVELPAGGEAGAWVAAERVLAGPLAGAAAAVARLDERLLAPARRGGARRQLALLEIADLVWAEGYRLRPERLALFDLDRTGRTAADAVVLGRAGWALRRARAVPRPIEASEDVAEALAHRLGRAADGYEASAKAEAEDFLPSLDAARAEGWLAVLPPAGACHPLTRAGAGFAIWRRGRPEALLEPAVLAAALALGRHDTAGEPAGLTCLPLALGQPSARLGQGGDAEARLAGWLAAVTGAAEAGRRRLLALETWRACAAERTSALQGRGPGALADLFLERPILSAPIAARALGRTAARLRTLLATFEHLGLTREMTGQGRFRYWQPRL